MSKLFKLKQWVTLQEAAQHLTNVFDEEATEADICRFALDGHLKLSVNFVNHTTACCGTIVPLSEAKRCPGILIPDRNGKLPEPYEVILGLKINDIYDGQLEERVVNFEEKIVTLAGVWDLTMLGGERLDIEHKYQMMTGGAPIELINLDGTYVAGVAEGAGTICSLMEHFNENPYYSEERKTNLLKKPLYDPSNYYPAGGLPHDAVLVVRTQALTDLIQSLNDTPNPTEKPLSTNERNTLLTIIAALCARSEIKHQERGAAVRLANMTQEIGAAVTDDTIRNILAKIPDALEARMK